MPSFTGEAAEEYVGKEIDRQEEARKDRDQYSGDDELDSWRHWSRRWFMAVTPRNEDGRFATFLDGLVHPAGYRSPFSFAEHQVWDAAKRRMYYFTCIEGDLGPDGKQMTCPACKKFGHPSVVTVYTVIDHHEFEDKKGNKRKDELKLLVAKTAAHVNLQKQAKKRGGLRGWRVEITRSTSDAAATGDVFSFEEQVNLPEDLQPPDYKQIFFCGKYVRTEQQLQAYMDSVLGKKSESNRQPRQVDTEQNTKKETENTTQQNTEKNVEQGHPVNYSEPEKPAEYKVGDDKPINFNY